MLLIIVHTQHINKLSGQDLKFLVLNIAVPIATSSFKMLHQYMYRFGSEALCRSVISKTVVAVIVMVVVAVVEKTWSASYSNKDARAHTHTHMLAYTRGAAVWDNETLNIQPTRFLSVIV